jgi:hypothetical protein
MQSSVFLANLLGSEHPYAHDFRTAVENGYIGSVQHGVGILKAVREDLASGELNKPKPKNPLLNLEQICNRFHAIARQLRSRHADRSTLNVQDEYDVQDLLHSLLLLFFDDVREEEATPSHAGKCSRGDFLLKTEQIIVEAKKSRGGLNAKELGSQLIEDIDRYKTHPDCKALVCFVYDPEGLIANPRGIESDLTRDAGPFPVRVFVRP